ncbi:MAG: DsbA family protein [Pseudomonadota bacterium]
MTRTLWPALLMGLTSALAAPLAAQDLEEMIEAERDAFRAEIRAYLLENPEVLMEAIAILEEREEMAATARDMQLVARHASALFEAEHDLIEGNPDGDITIVEFLDYRCGFCRRAAPEMAELLEADGNIRLVVKELPILGEQSVLASRFALSSRYVEGEEAYADLHAALLAMRADVSVTALRRLADNLGYDGDAILDGMEDPRIDAVIDANYALARNLQISGTPTFVMSGQVVRGFVDADAMAALVAAERAAIE